MWKKQSKFRLLEAEEKKSAHTCLNVAGPLNSAFTIACSQEHTAFAWNQLSQGTLALIPLNPMENSKPLLLQAHKGPVSEFSFSPFDSSSLASVGSDGSVKLWNISADERKGSLQMSFSPFPSRGGNSLSWNPSSENILVAGGSTSLVLLDASEGEIASEMEWDDCICTRWNSEGSAILALSKDGKIIIGDPRAFKTSFSCGCISTPLSKATSCLPMSENYFACLGHDAFKRPHIAIYDNRDTSKTLVFESFDASVGVNLAEYDPDTQLLVHSVRGSSSLCLYDMKRSLETGKLSQMSTFVASDTFQGLALSPKLGLDFLNSEVLLIQQLSMNSVQPISWKHPQKVQKFNPDLYPATASMEPAQSSQEFLAGNNASPLKENVAPKDFIKKIQDTRDIDEKQIPTEQTSDHRQKLNEAFKKSKFTNMKGSETGSKERSWYELKLGKDLRLGRNIRASSRYMALPWASMGGSVMVVLPLDNRGRVDANIPLLRVHSNDLSAFDVSCSQDLLATGSVDGSIRIWDIPSDGVVTSDISQCSIELVGTGRIGNISFHPSAKDVLISSSSSVDFHSVRFWDLVSEKCRIHLDSQHPEFVSDFSLGTSKDLLLTTCRDNLVRLFDVRSGTEPQFVYKTDEVLRDTQVQWMDDYHFTTFGWAKGSSRQMSLWDSRKPEQSLSILQLDQSISSILPFFDHDTGVLFVGSEGERTIRYFEVDLANGEFSSLGRYVGDSIIKSLSFCDKSQVDVQNVEIARALRLGDSNVNEISFKVPRKRKEFFQDDIFVPTKSSSPRYTSEEWFSGCIRDIEKVCLCPTGMTKLSEAPPAELTVRERKRIDTLQCMQKDKGKARPSMVEHFQKFEVVETARIVRNRWDACPIVSEDVDEDEWDD